MTFSDDRRWDGETDLLIVGAGRIEPCERRFKRVRLPPMRGQTC
jgi:hypothetical protein